MHGRKQRRHADVAFALNEHERSVVGGNEVGTGDSGVGGDELPAQDFAAESGQLFAGVEGKAGLEFAFEERGDALARVMESRSDEVRRLLVGHLKDEFGEVAFGDFDSDFFQGMVEAGLVRRDAFALHHELHVVLQKHVADVVVGIDGGFGQEEVSAIGANAGFELAQQIGKLGDGVFFDTASAILHRVVVGNAGHGVIAIAIEGLGVVPDGGALHAQRHPNGFEQRLLVALVGYLTGLDITGLTVAAMLTSGLHLRTMTCKRCGP